MDTLLIPITDIIKHYVNHHYLTYDDAKFNMLLYSLLAVILSLITKHILNFEAVFTFFKYIKWHIMYSILRMHTIVPINSFYIKNPLYSPYDFKYKNNHTMYIMDEGVNEFANIIECLRTYNDNAGNNINSFKKKTSKSSVKNLLRYTTIKTSLAMSIARSFSHNTVAGQLLYIDGYYIYIDIERINQYAIELVCANKEILDRGIEYFYDMYSKTYEINECGQSNTLEIFEYESDANICNNIGLVKTQLTFDNYVSRHKTHILTYLDNFKDNKLNKDNIFIDNNLGFLLYGTYGTGKTFLITAIANYLKRSIYNINFAKIKTKKQFRKIMTNENISKFVFCFDEFDYLLTNIINQDVDNINYMHSQKLALLSNQLSALKDNKEASEGIIKQMKDLMEEGTSDIITYEFLLSELSGITSVQNRIIIATTNFVDKIPKALIRPGRFDIILRLDTFNKEEIIELLGKLYKLNDKQLNDLKYIKFKENTFTPAMIIMQRNIHDTIDKMVEYLSN